MSQNLPFYFIPIDEFQGRACVGVQLVLAPWPRGRLSVILREEDLAKVTEWCVKNSCGVREQYDVWSFVSSAERTHFLLKWG
jgi:hypothetical protein